MKLSPTHRTKKLLEDNGWTVAIVERWNQACKIRQDMLGFADLFAYKQDVVALVQCTSSSSLAPHRDKLVKHPNVEHWLRSMGKHGYVLLVTWGKRGARGKRKLWTPNIERGVIFETFGRKEKTVTWIKFVSADLDLISW